MSQVRVISESFLYLERWQGRGKELVAINIQANCTRLLRRMSGVSMQLAVTEISSFPQFQYGTLWFTIWKVLFWEITQ